METDADFRVVDTDTLLRLSDTARSRRYNRQLPLRILRKLDPDGRHVLKDLMLHTKTGSSKASFSIRAFCCLKLKGKDLPYETILDFDVAEFTKIPIYERTPDATDQS